MVRFNSSKIKEWKNLTHHFNDTDIWKERLECIGLENEADFCSLLEMRQKTNFHNKENLTFKEIFHNRQQSEKQDCLSLSISKYLVEYFKEKYTSYEKLNCLAGENLFSDIYYQIQTQTEQLVRPVLEFEFEVYKEAYNRTEKDFSFFLSTITYSEEWLDYFVESYPVLLKKLEVYTEFIQKNTAMFLNRLDTDWIEICHYFGYQDITHLDKITLFLGDPHNGGKSIVSLEGSLQDNKKLTFYYKPKPLSPDIYWNNLGAFLQKLGLLASFIPTRNIDKADYGWQQGIQNTVFVSAQAVKSFFYRQGINAALAYFFSTQDLIADNLMICRDYPVFFDLEMSLCPQIPPGSDYRTRSIAGTQYLKSVIKTGLIPSYGFETARHTGYSNSGISYVKDRKNLPILDGQVVQVNAYGQEFENGFRYAYLFFINHKTQIADFLSASKRQLANMRTRVLLRLTFTYSQLYKEAFSPNYLSDPYEYYKLYEHLWRGYDKSLLPGKIIQNEIDQLLQGDIPYYTAHPLSKDLYDGYGNLIKLDYFRKSGFETVLEKIAEAKPSLMQEQIHIIRRALYIHNDSDLPVEYPSPVSPAIAPAEPGLSAIEHIASFIYNLDTSKDQKYFAYCDYIISKDDMWDQGIQNMDMFQGIEGIGVFLAAYYALSQDSYALSLALKIFDQSLEFLHHNKHRLFDNHTVKMGIINYPLSTIYYSLLGNEIVGKDLFRIEEDSLSIILNYMEAKLPLDEHYCYFSGSTGALLLLMKLYEKKSLPRIYNLIEKTGFFLLSAAVQIDEDRISWSKRSFDKWGGFAHGNSSTAYALFKLADFLRNDVFYKAGMQALSYDQGLFNAALKKWDKSIDFEGDTHHSWGNGSAGIGLSRYLITPYYQNDFMKYEIDIAKENIDCALPTLLKTDYSICSGALGMLEIRALLDTHYDPLPTINQMLTDLPEKGLRCGGWEKNPVVTGLFYGYAGIGYNLIKLLYNKKIPSLLWI